MYHRKIGLLSQLHWSHFGSITNLLGDRVLVILDKELGIVSTKEAS
jgi:hypothetical protein